MFEGSICITGRYWQIVFDGGVTDAAEIFLNFTLWIMDGIINIITANSRMFEGNLSSSKPTVYIITPDFNSDHIQELVEELGKNAIPYCLQREGDTLGQPLNKRFFVIVDNIKGTVVLGPEFSSLLMFIVGYPRKGTNKKNHYCKRTADVVQRYRQFRKLPELERVNFSTFTIKTKSQRKSNISIPRSKQSSLLLHNRSQSLNSKQNNQSGKPRSITQFNEDNKVFLMKSKISAQKDKYLIQYNKVVSKIAISNPDKFKIVQNFVELKSSLQSYNNPYSYLLVSQQNLSLPNIDQNKNLKFLVYRSPKKKWMQVQNGQQKLESDRIKYVSSLQQVLNAVEGQKEQGKQKERAKTRIRKLDLTNKEQKQKAKEVAWANRNQQFKIEPSQSSKVVGADSYTKTYPQSQRQIGKSWENQIPNMILSMTEPGANQNPFSNNYIRQQKALDEIQIQYYNTNAPKLFENRKENSQVEFTKSNRPRVVSILAHENVLSLAIESQKSTVNMKNNDLVKGVSNPLPSPPQQGKSTVTLENNSALNPRGTIRKIRRVKSSNTNFDMKKISLSSQNIQKPSSIIQSKLLQRKFVLPEEYCAPVSPPSSMKLVKRFVRSYSQQPEVKYIEEDSRVEGIRLKKQRISPQLDSNYFQRYQNNKKSQVFLSTTGTDDDFLFMVNNLGPSDCRFRKQPQTSINQIPINNEAPRVITNQSPRNTPAFSTFGVIKPYSKQQISSQTLSSNKQIQQRQPSLVSGLTNPNLLVNQKSVSKLSSFSSFPSRKITSAKPTCILWKDFNFDIEEGINQINRMLNGVSIQQHYFYGVSEFQRIIKSVSSEHRFIFMIDEDDFDKLLYSVYKMLANNAEKGTISFRSKVLGIYLYPKSENPVNCSLKLRQFLSRNPQLSASLHLNELIKVISQNDYYESKKFVAKEVIKLICASPGHEETNQF